MMFCVIFCILGFCNRNGLGLEQENPLNMPLWSSSKIQRKLKRRETVDIVTCKSFPIPENKFTLVIKIRQTPNSLMLL